MMLIKRNYKGMSLVEIMGAIFVLSFAVLAVATIFPAGLQMNRKTKIRIQAIQMASGIIEELRHLPYYENDPNKPAPCLLDLATTETNINNPISDGWGGFDPGYGDNGSSVSWTPNIVINSDTWTATSRVFFRSRSGLDMRRQNVDDDVDNIDASLMIPSIRIAPPEGSPPTYPYGGVSRSRIHKIIVTVHIEEFVAGTRKYSYIQLINYRSDGLNMTPGY